MVKHHYKDDISQHVTYSGGDFLYSSVDEFPVMPIAKDICGHRWAYADMHILT